MRRIARIAPAIALFAAAIGATPLRADTTGHTDKPTAASPAEEGPTVRVVNNYGAPVNIYVVGSDDRRHLLGRVGLSEFKSFQIASELTLAPGAVQLKVHPAGLPASLGTSAFEPAGIKTGVLLVAAGRVIEVWVDQVLTRTAVRVVER